MKQALADMDLQPFQVLFVSGIGQAAKAPHYLRANVFNGLHGRSLPVATAAKLANHELMVIAQSGDGCNYGEGGNHFLAAIRRNIDITLVVHNNMVYGLTKGQASPTSEQGFETKAQPKGAPSSRFNAPAVAIAMDAGFVARGFAGNVEQVSNLIQLGVRHKGFSLVEIFQPCVSFNKVNTFKWFKERCYELGDDYDPTDRRAAQEKADEWGDQIPTGVLYRREKTTFGDHFPILEQGPLARQEVNTEELRRIIEAYG
jgi:2-oxoglutarate ferredoxin oxidoreductase subunit beta